jgi:hypothetical protein
MDDLRKKTGLRWRGMRTGVRSLLAALLVIVMLGTGVAFATGVNFSPRAQFCLGNLFGYGNVCTTVKPAKAKHKKHHKKPKKHKKHNVKAQTISRGPAFTG